jgi:diguanylate cyclase (GGDEF)-like protein
MLMAEPVTADVPCLLLTADPTVDAKRDAFDHGAVDYLTKPIDAGELIPRLHARIAAARLLREERRLKETDELTGLPNRRALRRVLARAHEASRSRGTPLTVVLIDVDGLKRINDGFGHAIGDRAIRAVADALRASRRDHDVATRLGGDEFAVVIPDADLEGAARFIARVQAALGAIALDGAQPPIEVRVSHGAATLGHGEAVDALLERADHALYACKRRRADQAAAVPRSE